MCFHSDKKKIPVVKGLIRELLRRNGLECQRKTVKRKMYSLKSNTSEDGVKNV